MNNSEFSKIFIESILKGFIEAFKVLWTIDEFKSAIIGIPVSVITFRIVGGIFSYGRAYGIWFGRKSGKIIYYLINTFIIWLVMKVV